MEWLLALCFDMSCHTVMQKRIEDRPALEQRFSIKLNDGRYINSTDQPEIYSSEAECLAAGAEVVQLSNSRPRPDFMPPMRAVCEQRPMS